MIRPLCAVVTAIEGVVQWTVVVFRVCVEVDFWAAYLIQTYKKQFGPIFSRLDILGLQICCTQKMVMQTQIEMVNIFV